MNLQLYNSATRKKEIFTPIKKGRVSMYTCGPTVYWYQHIGNLRSYVFADILHRVLEYNNYQVKHVANITDVGHLTNDSDDGDDKMEQAAKKEGKTAQEIANYYFEEFHKDLQKLHTKEMNTWCKATEHITEQILLIEQLEEKGYTYQTNDGIYFDTSKFSRYGKLSGKKVDDLQAGKRTDMREKKHTTDFALWKFSTPEDQRQQEWDSPWGTGFPGWHIECSAMASKYLGKEFDIHTGGEDHRHIHHENEIAQSEAAFDKHPWVHYWMHGAFLIVPGGKMGKSKGNIETLTELQKRGIPPMAFKYFLYTAHYRKPLTWSTDAIESAQTSYNRLKEILTNIKEGTTINKEYLQEFTERINDDLDMPGAIAVLWKLVRDKEAKGKYATIKKMDEVFALNLLEKEKINIPNDIKLLAEERLIARQHQDFKTSDKLREKIHKKGWEIKDHNNSYKLIKL